MDNNSAAITLEKLGVRTPIGDYPFYTLIETHGSVDSHDNEKLHAFLEEAMGEGYVADGVVAQDSAQVLSDKGVARRDTDPRRVLISDEPNLGIARRNHRVLDQIRNCVQI